MTLRSNWLQSAKTRGLFAVAVLGGIVLHGSGALADDDASAGQHLFVSRCEACHSLTPTRKPGPLLSGIYGRRAGSVPGYHYSAALKAAGITWNASNLDRWLTDPPKFIPGVNMQAQVDNPQQRQEIIAYLRSISPKVAQGGAAPSH